MPVSILAVVTTLFFLAAYFFYAKRFARHLGLNEHTVTPAVRKEDGFDYVPTGKGMLLAQHFASIAAAGPVVGPIAAGLAFGWGPTLLWILLGCVFIGACHDFSSLVASVRNEAQSVTELARDLLGARGYKLSLAFIWMCLLYVIVAFTDVTSQQFIAKEEWGGVLHDVGGGVATSSILYLVLSVLMGIATTKFRVPLWLSTVIFFPALLGIIVLGQSFPIVFAVEEPTRVWGFLILVYCAFASLLPMWLLLQPRGYLGGFFLYLILFIGAAGLCLGGFTIEYPFFRGFFSPRGESLYPFLFITVACGACSGFHGLVCCGTTSKQLRHETHAPLVGYGAMLLEGVVAVMALTTVILWPLGSPILSKSPAEIYATGIARFAHSVFGLDPRWGLSFGMLAFATFVYDTLDVATRLSRYLLDELFGAGKFMATVATLAVPMIYVAFSPAIEIAGKRVPLWSAIWSLFGSSNQLLAALTLLLTSLWMRKIGRSSVWLLLPAAFMWVTASAALVMQGWAAIRALSGGFTAAPVLNLVVSLALLILSGAFAADCARRLKSPHAAA